MDDLPSVTSLVGWNNNKLETLMNNTTTKLTITIPTDIKLAQLKP